MASQVPAPMPGAPRRGAQVKANAEHTPHAAQASPAPKSKSSQQRRLRNVARAINAPVVLVFVGGFSAWLAFDKLGVHVVTAADRLGGHAVTAADRLGGHAVTAADRSGKHNERSGVVAGTRIGVGLSFLGICAVAASQNKP
jgi:hypothetical protein